MDSKTNKSVWLSVFAVALIAGSGFLLFQTINVYSHLIDIRLTFLLVLVSVLLYIFGASWMGRMIVQGGSYWKIGGFHNGITFAWLVIGVGVLLLGLNGGALPIVWKAFLISWPMLLFVIGCCELCKFHYGPGILVASIGTFFLIPRFSGIYPNTSFDGLFMSTWWPVFIIIGGIWIFISILLKPKKFQGTFHCRKDCNDENAGKNQSNNHDGQINYKTVFGAMEQVILEPVFKGGTIETVFGGTELDLRRTSLAEGETFLYIKAVFGGVEIKAPIEWNIEIRAASSFGGITDDRYKTQNMDYSRTLIITGEAVFGGISIEN
ncbi:MAG: cell wall-active antibiotics response protein [Tannerella sp.]|jgi:predicted membrane protein|nr:cell wall-active antibiotics response protein [Tannerella sp.]